MTNHLAAIREAAQRIVANGREEWMGDKALLLISSRLHGQEILRLLDAAEKDSTCHVVDTDYQYDECSKCKSALYPGDFCSGCGRRIERCEGAK